MARKLSRRSISSYIADQLIAGETTEKDIATQLAAYLIDTRRTKEATTILRDIDHYLADKGHVLGTITSAFSLDASTKELLEAYAKRQTGASYVNLDEITDPSVLGGVKITLPGKELDATIARQLTVLKTRFKKA